MVGSYRGSVPRDEQTAERSEAASYRGDALARLDQVVGWIAGIPLTRKICARNLARDFSDAVLMSEIFKFYYPNLVASHNYITANNIQGKRDNWNVLNRKVLTKIDMRLSPDVIENLVHSQAGTIDKLLLDFRDKQMRLDGKSSEDGKEPVPDYGSNVLDLQPIRSPKQQQSESRSVSKTALQGLAYLLLGVFRIVVVILCFWKWFPGKSASKPRGKKNDKVSTPVASTDRDNSIHDKFVKTLEELVQNKEMIQTLRHKIAFLEGTIKLKDTKIASLEKELNGNSDHHATESVQSARLSFGQRLGRKSRVPLF